MSGGTSCGGARGDNGQASDGGPGVLWLEPSGVRSAAARMTRAGDAMERAVQALRHALDAEGECWGHDESGEKFAKEYVPLRDKQLEGLGKIVEVLHKVGEGLGKMVDDFERRDADNSRALGGTGA
ncbi:hypothetical protein LX15_003967 [Streptoalloteichus tenebrarius]|uniref:WXG100 family type VII secretion target n=1 Tax=Streptoalloteichus tenebrarius (strain ATCC 17920 / DSM 40477 / JCM 4838 / CBS 697.72 / NBRC 16177 / NCIMB 11028 / NRRL B-12390 / A12253. 1 / ISP 5477) TaxID=1933 RepID=A0ABT1HXK1_STRSD|nr:hypothetical protein [Streptoalloteichus tenebrarius]MCP2260254.1 hypothetical protein [Streptoalloteichus tenebrarius]